MTTRKMCASYSLVSGAALALFVASAPAPAKEVTVLGQLPVDQLTERVSYSDLDLATPYGMEYGTCRSFAWTGARPQMQQAMARAQQIASTGTSAIAPVAIMIVAK